MSSSEEMRKRVRVVAIAPAAYIDDELCHTVQHYRVENDIVPKIDRAGLKRNRDTTTVLKSLSGSMWDHSFNSPSYQTVLLDEIRTFIQEANQYVNSY
ncbi:MAG: hypothetical protein S4CHLAM81_11300 [Chlamydiales bacterium]|nr:hypothetical protein [Chlamydiales bacterium]MCH9635908.1 hypothetical protein [Chlamydiales bacterium]